MITDRTWFGLARRKGPTILIEGAFEPSPAGHDKAQLLVVDEVGPICWLLLEPVDVNEQSVLNRLSALPIDDQRGTLPEMASGDLTIAVCTRERPEFLQSCLERLHTAVDNEHDVLVVDNAPETERTERVVASFDEFGMRIRRVVEPRRGVSRARNLALQVATTKYLAFVDDDTLPDAGWPNAILRGFSRGSNVAVVTGIVPPAQIETPSQALFERKVKWSNNLTPETFSMVYRNNYAFPFPYSAGHFGTSANFAVDRMIVSDLGGFDEALGAGVRSAGGEDMEFFVRVLRHGYELTYEPNAIVWHVHRRDDEALRKVIFGYGKGLSAAALSEFLQPGKLDMLRGSLQGIRNLAKARQSEVDYGMPRSHLALEVAGVLCGPTAYLWERFRGPKG